jgi:hypothetical protein
VQLAGDQVGQRGHEVGQHFAGLAVPAAAERDTGDGVDALALVEQVLAQVAK